MKQQEKNLALHKNKNGQKKLNLLRLMDQSKL